MHLLERVSDAQGQRLVARGRPAVQSGEDGRFRLAFAAASNTFYLATLAAERLGPRRFTRQEVQAGEEIELGDVTLEPGWLLRGEVVLDPGEDLGLARVAVQLPRMPHRPDLSPDTGVLIEPVAGDRSFQLGPVPSGEHEVRLMSERWELREPARVRVGAALPPDLLRLRVQEKRSIRGTVWTAEGRPVSGARIVPLPVGDGSQVPACPLPTITAANGTFAMFARDDEHGPGYRLRVLSEIWPEHRTEQALAWGQIVTITLPPGEVVDLRVLDRGTGAPVPQVRVARMARGSYRVGQFPEGERMTPDPEGRLRVGSVGSGHQHLLIRAEGYAPARTPSLLDRSWRGAAWTVWLDRPASLHLEVLDGQETPVAGCELEAVGDTEARFLCGPLPGAGALVEDPQYGPRQVLARGATDASGRLTFRDIPPGKTFLRCLGRGGPPMVHGPVNVPGGSDPFLRLVIPASGRVTLRTSPTHAVHRVRLRQLDGPWLLPTAGDGVPVDASGTAMLERVPRGLWRIEVARKVVRARPWDARSAGEAVEWLDRDALTTRGIDATADVVAENLALGRVRVQLDGSNQMLPSVALAIRCERADGSGVLWTTLRTAGPSGVVEFDGIPAGAWRVCWQERAPDGDVLRGCERESSNLRAGEIVSRRVTLRHCQVGLRLVRNGRPMAHQPVRLMVDGAEDDGVQSLMVTDASGGVRCVLIEPGRWRITSPSGQEFGRIAGDGQSGARDECIVVP